MRSSPPRSSHPGGSRLRTVGTIIVALLVIAGLVAPAVLAHAQLLSSNPTSGATLPTADEVSLTFSEDINADFVQIVAEGPDGDIADGDPVVAGAVVTQPIAPIGSGLHTVTYRVVSADGHPVSGSVTFTLTDVATESPTTDATTVAPETPEPATPVSNDEAVASATGTESDQGGSSTWLVAGGLGALLAAGGGVAWAARNRRHPEH
ncbi:MAG: copper resistance CopC family protein [Dermatophilaceae bacterium]